MSREDRPQPQPPGWRKEAPKLGAVDQMGDIQPVVVGASGELGLRGLFDEPGALAVELYFGLKGDLDDPLTATWSEQVSAPYELTGEKRLSPTPLLACR